MKNLPLYLSIFATLIFACEANQPEPIPELDYAGEYVGTAQIYCAEYRSYSNRIDTIVFLSETFPETFYVTDDNPQDSILNIRRESYDTSRNGNNCTSSYDIGAPTAEYFLSDGKRWAYGYTYDREWDCWIEFGAQGVLTGYMLDKEKFGALNTDSTGAEYYAFPILEYSVTATRVN